MLLGIISGRKIAFLRVIVLSLAHGWSSIGIFLAGGILRQSTYTRLGNLLNRENTLHFVILCLGILLVVNASIPPTPAFFPEVIIVRVLNRVRPSMLAVFLLLRFTVCYYNAYLFLWTSQVKSSVYNFLNHSTLDILLLSFLTKACFISLGFLFKL